VACTRTMQPVVDSAGLSHRLDLPCLSCLSVPCDPLRFTAVYCICYSVSTHNNKRGKLLSSHFLADIRSHSILQYCSIGLGERLDTQKTVACCLPAAVAAPSPPSQPGAWVPTLHGPRLVDLRVCGDAVCDTIQYYFNSVTNRYWRIRIHVLLLDR
jgi:hypothetical protein